MKLSLNPSLTSRNRLIPVGQPGVLQSGQLKASTGLTSTAKYVPLG